MSPKCGRMLVHHTKWSNIASMPDPDVAPMETQKRHRPKSPHPKQHAVEIGQLALDEDVIKTSAHTKSSLDEKITRLFYDCNLPSLQPGGAPTSVEGCHGVYEAWLPFTDLQGIRWPAARHSV